MKNVSELVVALKSGEYDGVDIMNCWITLERLQSELWEAEFRIGDYENETG